MEPSESMQWQFGQAYPWPGVTASPAKYLNRATVLDGLLLANSERPTIPAPEDTPENAAAELIAAAQRGPDLVATPMKWANGLLALGDPWSLALLVNTAVPSITTRPGVPINKAMQPRESG